MKPGDMSEHLSWEELTTILSYNPETGVFIKNALTKHQKERLAGTNKGSPYTRICINHRIYMAHRLAWYYMTGSPPDMLIDHINGDKRDNRFCNLRLADYSQNMMNSKLPSSNTSGCKGVTWVKKKKRWRASGKLNGKKIYLGLFANKEDAANKYQEFAKQNHGEFYLETKNPI